MCRKYFSQPDGGIHSHSGELIFVVEKSISTVVVCSVCSKWDGNKTQRLANIKSVHRYKWKRYFGRIHFPYTKKLFAANILDSIWVFFKAWTKDNKCTQFRCCIDFFSSQNAMHEHVYMTWQVLKETVPCIAFNWKKSFLPLSTAGPTTELVQNEFGHPPQWVAALSAVPLLPVRRGTGGTTPKRGGLPRRHNPFSLLQSPKCGQYSDPWAEHLLYKKGLHLSYLT